MPAAGKPKTFTFLAFRSGAEEAMNLYTSLFADAEVHNVIRARAGEPGWTEGTLQHAAFSFAGQHYMCINMPPHGAQGHDHAPWHEYGFSPAFAIFVQCESDEEFNRLYAALSEGGEVITAPGRFGFSRNFTWLNDRFGMSWRINLSADVPVGNGEAKTAVSS
ncbi:MAG TPA: VOC family protein [Actinophytocola sp.]|uniref:VOC family protein n=1 Tax=Actinophytocola sp. TaxID=1872138 RepID=UPI002DDD7317|nr:VOC family protein [Actinophytocola sp.]HEV2778134.1 VOC family protein [Actinophytocola sp.]